jgi:uncharacterized protein DUF1844
MTPAGPDEGFKVTDRRRRADGDPVGVEVGHDAAPAASGPAGGAGPDPHGSAAPDPARSLTGLFVMFASSALIALGESPDPVTGQVHTDLAQAGEAIDILTLLREKTEGNRSPEETQLLEQIIYDLQLRFVRATGARSG